MSGLQSRSVALLACALLALASQNSLAACWRITDTDGATHTATDIWQLKSRLDTRSTLMGTVGGKKQMIPVAEVRTIEFAEQKGGWLSRLGGSSRVATLGMRSGEKTEFESEMALSYREGSETRRLDLKQIGEIVRCQPRRTSAGGAVSGADYGVIDTVITPTVAPASNNSRVYLYNGDILDGRILTPELIIKTDYALLSLKVGRIKGLTHPQNDIDRITLDFDRDNRATGEWLDASLELQLSEDQIITLESDMIRAIEFSRRLATKPLELEAN